MFVFLIMVVMGLLLGFIGAGGSGFIIAILTTFFGVPVHTALGTSLSAMVFTSLSGTYSHFRENNVVIKAGLATGLFGAVGAFIGSQIAQHVPGQELEWLTASMLFVSAFLLWLRIFTKVGRFFEKSGSRSIPTGMRFWLTAVGVGIVTGMLSGLFGIGASPFIQIGLLVFFGLTVQQSAGTTLLVILPVAFVGGFGYYSIGNLDIMLLIEVAAGTIIGSYIGAKFTTRLHPTILKTALVAVPAAGGLLLLLGG